MSKLVSEEAMNICISDKFVELIRLKNACLQMNLFKTDLSFYIPILFTHIYFRNSFNYSSRFPLLFACSYTLLLHSSSPPSLSTSWCSPTQVNFVSRKLLITLLRQVMPRGCGRVAQSKSLRILMTRPSWNIHVPVVRLRKHIFLICGSIDKNFARKRKRRC